MNRYYKYWLDIIFRVFYYYLHNETQKMSSVVTTIGKCVKNPIWCQSSHYEQVQLYVTKDTKIYLDKDVILQVMQHMSIDECKTCELRINVLDHGIELNDGLCSWITENEIPKYDEQTKRLESNGEKVDFIEISIQNEESLLRGVDINNESLEGYSSPSDSVSYESCECETECICYELVVDNSTNGTYIGSIPKSGLQSLKKTPLCMFNDGSKRHNYIDVVTHKPTGETVGYFVHFVCRGVGFEEMYNEDREQKINKLYCKEGAVAIC